MQAERIKSRQRSRGHRLLFLVLIALLVAFSLWSLWLLSRAHQLRGELDFYFGWLDQVQAVRGELERWREQGAAVEEKSGWLETFRREAEQLLRQTEDPGVRVALQKLRLALDQVAAQAADSLPGDASDTLDSDALWQASVAALAAAEELGESVRGHVTRLHRSLGAHWRSLRWLVAGALLLAGSNLALLFVIQRRRLEVEKAHEEVLRSARHDPLTGLWNREGILRLLGHELVRAARSQTPLSVILADLDNFQAVNELLGHDQGDYILEQVSKRLVSLVRPYDSLGRVGGDSFLLVLPDCDGSATNLVVERLRAAVNDRDVKHAFGRIRVTLNLALRTVKRASETDVDTLLRQLQTGIDVSKTIPRPTFT